MTNTDRDNTTYCKYFTNAFWHAFYEKNADLNNDGRISLKEAYNKAIKVHKEELSYREDETN